MIAVRSIVVIPLLAAGVFAVDGDESPRALVEAAIQAHGGKANIDKTRCGNLSSKMTAKTGPETETTFEWEENYELPRRYRRKANGEDKGKKFEIEFAFDGVNRWTREDGVVGDFPRNLPADIPNWCTLLLYLPHSLKDGVKLRSAGTEKIDGQPAKVVVASGAKITGELTLLLDEKTNRLVQLRSRGPHIATGETVETLFKLGDFKNVDGVAYPHRLEVVLGKKTPMRIEYTRIEFPKTLDDKLFAKPK